METNKIRINTKPYIPDIYNNYDFMNTKDEVSLLNPIIVNKVIFIINLDISSSNIESYKKYNDPLYLLYGLIDASLNYNIPPIRYFYTNETFTNRQKIYKIIDYSYDNNDKYSTLLSDIGYNIEDIITLKDISNNTVNDIYNDRFLFYQKIQVYDTLINRSDDVIFIFFKNDSMNNVDYNKYNKTVYYEESYWNVFIYPYISEIDDYQYDINILPQIILNDDINNTKNIIIIKFKNYELNNISKKIDYKYLEKENNISNLEKTINNSNYIVNEDKKGDLKDIYISLNEILNFYYTVYSQKNTFINTNYNSYNKSYNTRPNIYSPTFDSKINYINKKFFNNKYKYSAYNNNLYLIDTDYPLIKNYYINSYFDINKLLNNTNSIQDLLAPTNLYLRKIILLINPLIINNFFSTNINNFDYITNPNNQVNLEVIDLKNNNNVLIFNNSKIILDITNNIVNTNTYYIDNFLIKFSFKRFTLDDSEYENEICTYYIYLNIAFYNSLYVNIVDKTITNIINDLGYINNSYLDSAISLTPCIVNLDKNILINEYYLDNNYKDIRLYNFYADYDYYANNKTDYNKYGFSNYYFMISNIKGELINCNNNYNLQRIKINNFIKNIIYLDNIFNIIKFNIYKTLNFQLISIVFDTTITDKYFDTLSYYNSYRNPIFINNLSDFDYNTQNKSLYPINKGEYYVFKYYNYNIPFSKTYLNSEILAINNLSNLLSNNYALLIKKNDYYKIDNDLYINNTLNNHLNNNIIKNFTNIYLVLLNGNGDIQYDSSGIIRGYELFNYYSNNKKIFTNLNIKHYMNLLTLNIYFDIYEQINFDNYLLFDKDNIKFDITNNNKAIIYDTKRFTIDIDISNNHIENLKSNMTEILYYNQNYISIFNIIKNYIIYISNNQYIIDMSYKIYYYLQILLLITDTNKQEYVLFIKYNSRIIYNIIQSNYNLNITLSNIPNNIYNIINELKNIDEFVYKEQLNNYKKDIELVINYYETQNREGYKIIVEFLEKINKTYIINVNSVLFNNILNEINTILKNKLYSKVIFDYLENNLISLYNNFFDNEPLDYVFINYLFIVLYNSTKLDNIINMFKLNNPDISNNNFLIQDSSLSNTFDFYNLNKNIIKEDFLYNNSLDVSNNSFYNIELYFSSLITKFSTIPELTSLDIIDILTEIISNYIASKNFLIGGYKYIYSIVSGSIIPVNLYDLPVLINLENYINNLNELLLKLDEIIINYKDNEYYINFEYMENYIINIKEYIFFVKKSIIVKNNPKYVEFYNLLYEIIVMNNNTVINNLLNQIINENYNTFVIKIKNNILNAEFYQKLVNKNNSQIQFILNTQYKIIQNIINNIINTFENNLVNFNYMDISSKYIFNWFDNIIYEYNINITTFNIYSLIISLQNNINLFINYFNNYLINININNDYYLNIQKLNFGELVFCYKYFEYYNGN